MATRKDEVDSELRGAARAVLADFPDAAAALGDGEDPEAFGFLVNQLMSATLGTFTLNAAAQALREATGGD